MDFNIIINKEKVYNILKINDEKESIDYNDIYNIFMDNISPRWQYKKIKTSHTPFCGEKAEFLFLCLYTVGDGINGIIDNSFSNGKYMEGLILDTISNLYLFEMGNIIENKMKEEYPEYSFSKKLVPTENIDISYQKYIVENLDIDISVNEYNILIPNKSLSFMCFAGKDIKDELFHNCRDCKNKDCIYRENEKVEISINNKIYLGNKGDNLLDFLKSHGFNIPNSCDKKGTCGKCRIKINGEMKLSCKEIIKEPIKIEFVNNKYSILDDFIIGKKEGKTGYGVAIDLGTTTISMVLIDLEKSEIINKSNFINPQVRYGSDVIMRIEIGISKLEELNQIIVNKLLVEISNIIKGYEINEIVISGNTPMIHLLLNKSPKSLAYSPYKIAEDIEGYYSFKEVFNSNLMDINIYITPYIDGFVGGDIVDGLLYENKFYNNYLLIDIGTNGEIVLKNNGKYFTTSTAAGSAFEGINIKYGIGGVDGAISSVNYNNGFEIKTINNKEPIGICGSGIVDIVYILYENGFINNQGNLIDKYFSKGVEIYKGIYFTQDDIRQIQLAKSAIRSGTEILIKDSGIGYGDIDNLIISGGMGTNINPKSGGTIGLYKRELEEKIVVLGNTSLGGSVDLLYEKDYNEIDRIKKGKYINLSNDRDFENYFIKFINF